MTIRKLKEIISSFDDDDRIIIDTGRYKVDAHNEVVDAFKFGHNGNEVLLQTRDDFDVQCELEAMLTYYHDTNWDELDAVINIFELGYTIDDFKYDNKTYEWIKALAEEHGLIGDTKEAQYAV